MAWNSFFSRNPLTTGVGIFGTGLTLGISISTWLAFETRDKCNAAAIAFIHHLGDYVDIPRVDGEIDIDGQRVNFSINNLNFTIPKAVVKIADGIDEIPVVCFNAAFTIALIVSILTSLVIANAAVTKILANNKESQPYIPLNQAGP